MAEPEEITLVEEIRTLAAKDPFVPFTVVMASGQRYEIGRGDIVVAGRSVLMLMPHAGGHHILRSSQISEVSVPPGEPT